MALRVRMQMVQPLRIFGETRYESELFGMQGDDTPRPKRRWLHRMQYLWEGADRTMVEIPDWMKDLLPLYIGMTIFLIVILLFAYFTGVL